MPQSQQETQRTLNEKSHGKWLLDHDPEQTWGWGTPAGKLRAQRRASLIAQGARLEKGMRVMEIGCGTGAFTERFLDFGVHITAVELSQDLISLALTRNLPKDRVHFLTSRFEDVASKDGFDAIIGSSVLHHLEIDRAFQNIFRLLKPGGLLSFAEPNLLNPQIFMERRFRSYFPHISKDEIAFCRWPLEKKLRQIGFDQVKIVPFDWLHPAVPKPLIPVVKTAEWFLERCPLIHEFAGSLCIQACRPRN